MRSPWWGMGKVNLREVGGAGRFEVHFVSQIMAIEKKIVVEQPAILFNERVGLTKTIVEEVRPTHWGLRDE